MKLVDRYRAANYLPENTVSPFGSWMQQTYGKNAVECMTATFASYATQGYSSNGVVFAVEQARAMLLSEATFKFRDLATKKLFGTPALEVLEQPWTNGTTGELITRCEVDAGLAGNSYTRRDPDRLVRLRPDWVDIVLNPVGGDEGRSRWDVLGYTYWPAGPSGGVEREFYAADEVAHWSPIPDPLAMYRGMSWLTPVVREINSDLAMTEYKRRFMDNNATPNLLIRYQAKLSDEAYAKVQKTWNAKYGGTDGLKTAVLDNGADVTVIGNTFAQMDLTNAQGAGESRIASAAGVPGIVVGLKEGMEAATYSNYSQAMRRFADLTGRPLWRSLCACLTQLVDVPVGAQLWYDTSDIAALWAGDKERAEILQTTSLAAQSLIMAGYVPDTVTAALVADDLTLLKHTGAVPTALYPDGKAPVKESTSP